MARKADKSPKQTTIAVPDAIDLIRFEKNLLQIGFFSAHDRRSATPDLSRKIEQWVTRDGKKIRASAEFRSSLGLPSTADRDKYMAFMKIAMDRRMAEGEITNPIRFSGYSMLKALGLSDSGANYEDLNQWGMRMADTTITSEQIIYSSSRRQFMNKTVHVFRSFTRVGESDLNGGSQTVQFAIELEDWLLENLNQSYVVPEDFTQYRKLVRPTAKGIFVYLYVWFYASHGKDVEKDYTELCTLLNVRSYQHVSKIRETMGLSLDDLIGIGYLKKWDILPMSSKKGFKLVLSPGRAIIDVIASTQQRRQSTASLPPADELNPAQQEMRNKLTTHGINPDKATSLAREHAPDALRDQLEYLATELARDQGRRIKNPAGFIIAFLDGRQPIPATFVSEARRGREAAAASRRREQLDARADAELEDVRLQDRYKAWSLRQASAAIAARFSAPELEGKLKDLRHQLGRDPVIAATLQRLTAEQRRAQLMRALEAEVLRELDLIPYDEWCASSGQPTLFDE